MARKDRGTASRFKCEVPTCMATFSRAEDRQRHVLEKHGPRKYCHVRNCKWRGAQRKARLRKHLDNYHPDEVRQTCLLFVPSDFPPGTPQSLASNSRTQTASSPDRLLSPSTHDSFTSSSTDLVQWQKIEPDTSDAFLLARTPSPPPQLNHTRALSSPASTKRRVFRPQRVRKRSASSSSEQFAGYRQEPGLFTEHRPVDTEVRQMATSFCNFGLDMDSDFDMGLGMGLDMDIEDDGN